MTTRYNFGIRNGQRRRPEPVRNGDRASEVRGVRFTFVAASELVDPSQNDVLRARLGGSAARSYVGCTIGAQTVVQAIAQGGSYADPSTYIPALAGATVRRVDLPGGSVSDEDVAAAMEADWLAFGVAATRVGAVVSVPNARDGFIGDAPALDAAGSFGRFGVRRMYLTGVANVANAGTLIRVVEMSAANGFTAPRGIVTGIAVHGSGGYQPRLAVGRCSAYPTPGTVTDIREGRLVASLAANAMGVVVLDSPLPFEQGDTLAILDCGGAAGTYARRAHGLAPAGNFNFGLNEAVFEDATRTDPTIPFGASYTPTLSSTLNFYDAHALVVEGEPYRRNGILQPTWYGTLRPATGDAPSSVVPSGFSDYQRMPAPQFDRLRATAVRVGMGTISPNDNMSHVLYQFLDLAIPTAVGGPRLGQGVTSVPTTANAYLVDPLADVPVGVDALGPDAIIAIGHCGGQIAPPGGPTTERLFFDSPGAGNNYLNSWPDTNDLGIYNDFIVSYGALAQYLVTTAAMPRNNPAPVWPATFVPGVGSTFSNIARFAFLCESQDAGFTVESYIEAA